YRTNYLPWEIISGRVSVAMQHGAYTVSETAYIANTDERLVTAEIEAGIVRVWPERSSKARTRLLDKAGVLYVSLIKPFRKGMDRALRSRFWAAVDDAVAKRAATASVGPLAIDMNVLTASVEPRLLLVERLHGEVTQDAAVCSGDPVLRGTRHRVHQ